MDNYYCVNCHSLVNASSPQTDKTRQGHNKLALEGYPFPLLPERYIECPICYAKHYFMEGAVI